MASDSPLADRERALEDAFFKKENERLIEELRAEREREAGRDALAEKLGLEGTAVLDSLLDQGLTAESATALRLIPLVAVGWADGEIDASERRVILESAREFGVKAGGAADELVSGWLDASPAPALLEAWNGVVSELCKGLDANAKNALREDLIGRARSVAQSAGGVFGIGAQSGSEKAMIEKLEQAFA